MDDVEQPNEGVPYLHRKPMDTRILGAMMYAGLHDPSELVQLMFGEHVDRRRDQAKWLELYQTMVELEVKKRNGSTNTMDSLTNKLLEQHIAETDAAPMPTGSGTNSLGSDSSESNHSGTADIDYPSSTGSLSDEEGHAAPISQASSAVSSARAQSSRAAPCCGREAGPSNQPAVHGVGPQQHATDKGMDYDDTGDEPATDDDQDHGELIGDDATEDAGHQEVWPDMEAAADHGVYSERLKKAIRTSCRRYTSSMQALSSSAWMHQCLPCKCFDQVHLEFCIDSGAHMASLT